ncbi:MAG: hypothetical protein WCA35_17670 [Kovacikia sp.]
MSTPQRTQRSRKTSEPRYWTTQEVVKKLKLPNDRVLRAARANGSAYRQDHYIVAAIGKRNKWEIFRRYRA